MAMRKKRAEHLHVPRMMFHQDKASLHRAAMTSLFLVVKSYLLGIHFADELSVAVKAAFANISVETFRDCFVNSWIQRYESVSCSIREYFEKD